MKFAGLGKVTAVGVGRRWLDSRSVDVGGSCWIWPDSQRVDGTVNRKKKKLNGNASLLCILYILVDKHDDLKLKV